MTQLLINGVQSVLPDGFEITLNEDNPEFTQRGVFSFNISLSLNNTVNSLIFKHIYRRNNVTLLKEADADLIVDNKTYQGKIIDIENTNDNVSFQFVSGNSQFNYDSKSVKIWEYDWGIETNFDYASAFSSVENPSYTKRYVCCPIQFSNGISNEIGYISTDAPEINSINNFTMNPYLYYYIDKLPTVFGYVMNSNVLANDELLKIMYIPGRIKSKKYSDFLPDMTVSEFITSLEEFFNVSFNFSSKNKTLDIVSNVTNIETKTRKKSIINDKYQRLPNSQPDIFNFKKLSYSLSGGINDFLKMPENIKSMCEIKVVSSVSYLKNILTQTDINKFIIYKALNTGIFYIFGNASTTNYFRISVPGTNGYLYPVDIFKDYESSYDSDKTYDLNVIPVDIIPYEMNLNGYVGTFPNGQQKTFKFTTQIPKINSNLQNAVDVGIISSIENGISEIQRSNKIEIGLYRGYCKILGFNGTDYNETSFPMSFVHKQPVFWLPADYDDYTNETLFLSHLTTNFYLLCNKSIDLNSIVNAYRPTLQIDTTYIYVFELSDKKLGPNDILVHEGAEYIPITFEKKIDVRGFINDYTGKFYRLK